MKKIIVLLTGILAIFLTISPTLQAADRASRDKADQPHFFTNWSPNTDMFFENEGDAQTACLAQLEELIANTVAFGKCAWLDAPES